ncbi:hypothetical protein [Helicobacter trogontum]|uniref:hypothetical protein n=1 Tax=Helicobacter trogontum TaxID=50960 RepID=UPI001319DFFC|nr:hypothetical protein [Helicobacter trogontum]
MYHVAWQSMLVEAIVFIMFGIFAAIALYFYAKKRADIGKESNAESKDSEI